MNKFFEDQARGHRSGPDDIENFLKEQAGSGLATYGGFRYHRPVSMKGNGFFGRMIKGGLLPIIRSVMPYLGQKAANAVSDFSDNIKQGKSFGSAAKGSLRKGIAGMARDLSSKLDPQEGEGVRRRRRKRVTKKSGKGNLSKLNPGLRKYLENKRKGLTGKSKSKKRRKGKRKPKKSIKQKKRTAKKTTKRRKRKSTKSRSGKTKPVNLLF